MKERRWGLRDTEGVFWDCTGCRGRSASGGLTSTQETVGEGLAVSKAHGERLMSIPTLAICLGVGAGEVTPIAQAGGPHELIGGRRPRAWEAMAFGGPYAESAHATGSRSG